MKDFSIVIPILFLSIGTLSSCNKWLDVSPRTEIKEQDLFSDRQGAIDALFATYQEAAAAEVYGMNLTFGLADILAQRYESKASTTNYYGQTARYNYMATANSVQYDTRTAINDTWNGMYKTIAQANYILKNIDETSALLGQRDYSIIKGEALALRALLHFDALRAFAPSYAIGATGPAIPYMRAFSVVPQEKLTVEGLLAACEQDLKEAESLLSVHTDIDQIAGNQGSTSLELFLMYRQNHMNYWAVKGLLARIALYKGDKPQALAYAREVIESGNFHFVVPTAINANPTSVNADLTFSSEHVFSIYVSDLKDRVDDFLKNTGSAEAEANDLYSTLAKLNTLYETATPGYGTDVRTPAASQSLWNQLTANVVYSRRFYSDNADNVKQRIIPVIKLAEMYYIAAEASASPSAGIPFLNAVRTARLLPELEASLTDDQFALELQKEYRKEFVGEGQLWFYYKRRGETTIPDGVGNPMTADKYTWPVPDNELEFGK